MSDLNSVKLWRERSGAPRPTLAAYASSGDRLKLLLRRRLLGEQTIFASTELADFANAARAADCAIAMLGGQGQLDLARKVADLWGESDLAPLILVLDPDPETVRCFARVRVAAILWPSELDRALAIAIERARVTQEIERVVAALQAVPGVPELISRAFSVALLAPRPIRTVAALARALGTSERTLELHWRQTAWSGSWRVKDLVDWVLLVRAFGERNVAKTWREAGGRVQVDERRLRRIALRLTGRSLQAVDAATVHSLLGSGILSEICPGLSALGSGASGGTDE